MSVLSPPRRQHRRADVRVEFRSAGVIRTLASDVVPLDPIAAEITAAGESGVLALVDERTGQDVVRWPLQPAPASGVLSGAPLRGESGRRQ
jgi:hypothetical protein